MVILISAVSSTGKTLMAQKLLEKYRILKKMKKMVEIFGQSPK